MASAADHRTLGYCGYRKSTETFEHTGPFIRIYLAAGRYVGSEFATSPIRRSRYHQPASLLPQDRTMYGKLSSARFGLDSYPKVPVPGVVGTVISDNWMLTFLPNLDQREPGLRAIFRSRNLRLLRPAGIDPDTIYLVVFVPRNDTLWLCWEAVRNTLLCMSVDPIFR